MNDTKLAHLRDYESMATGYWSMVPLAANKPPVIPMKMGIHHGQLAIEME